MRTSVRGRRLAGTVGVTGLALAALAAAAATPAYAAPADLIDGGAVGLLTIETNPSVFDVVLDPGEHDEWLLTVRSDAETPGALTVAVSSTGALASHPGGVSLEITECSLPWAGSPGVTLCPGAPTTHLPSTPFVALDPVDPIALGTIDPAGARHLRVSVALPSAPPAELQGTDADFVIRFRGVGEAQVNTGEPPRLPGTGADTAVSTVIAVGAFVAGGAFAVIAALTRRRQEVSS